MKYRDAIVGLMSLVGVGCGDYLVVGEYSCERNNGDKSFITAEKGELYASKRHRGSHFEIEYSDDFPREEALQAIDACVEAFAQKDKEEKE